MIGAEPRGQPLNQWSLKQNLQCFEGKGIITLVEMLKNNLEKS